MSERTSKETDVIYVAVSEQLWSEELSEYESYGLAAYLDGERIAFVSDVSTDGDAVALLAKRCTDGGLDPIHIYDVVEDLLCE